MGGRILVVIDSLPICPALSLFPRPSSLTPLFVRSMQPPTLYYRDVAKGEVERKA